MLFCYCFVFSQNHITITSITINGNKITKEDIKVGIKNIKGFGNNVLNKIEKNRPMGGWLDFTEFYKDNLELKMVPHNGIKTLIELGLLDGLIFCGKNLSRKAFCDIVDVYNEFSTQTKKNFKALMVKIFDNEDIVFNDLVSRKYLEKLLDIFNHNKLLHGCILFVNNFLWFFLGL